MAGRKRNGEGTIRKKADGRYEGRVALPDGRRRSVYGRTWDEAHDKLLRLQHDLRRGAPVVDERGTAGEYLAAWLEGKRGDLRPRSYARYEDAVRLYLVPALGKVKLAKLTKQHVRVVHEAMRRQGRAPATIECVHAVLRAALNDAVGDDLLVRNVAAKAGPKRVERPEMRHWSAEQARAFLRAVEGDPLEAFYAVALCTGMRRGEILALDWAHVDLDKGYAAVEYTLQDNRGGRFSFEPPKTDRSRRRVPLNRTAVAALRRHKARQNERRLAAGVHWRDRRGLVFTTSAGAPLRGNHILQRDFAPKVRALGLPRIRLHDLRHTTATLLHEQGYDAEDIAKVLGHSSATVTREIYLHISGRRLREATASLDRLLGPDSPTPALAEAPALEDQLGSTTGVGAGDAPGQTQRRGPRNRNSSQQKAPADGAGARKGSAYGLRYGPNFPDIAYRINCHNAA